MTNEPTFREAKAHVWKEDFAIVKAKKPMVGAFAVIKDKVETTVVIDQTKINDKDAIKAELNFKLITFDMVLPLGLVGFLAKVAKALAEKKISIFSIAAYSTDHILVKKDKIGTAAKALEKLGFEVKGL